MEIWCRVPIEASIKAAVQLNAICTRARTCSASGIADARDFFFSDFRMSRSTTKNETFPEATYFISSISVLLHPFFESF